MSERGPADVRPAATMTAAPLVPPPGRARRRWMTWLLWGVIFASGFCMGGVTGVVFVRNAVQEAFKHPEKMPERVVKRMKWQLGLSDAQVAEILPILRRRQRELQKIRAVAQPQVMHQLDEIEREVSVVLTETQRRKWLERFHWLREEWTPPLPKPQGQNDQ